MARITETVYLGRDNAIDLALAAGGADVDLSSVTQVDIIDKGCVWSVSSTTSPAAFDWATDSTKLVLKLGDETIAPGTYTVRLVIYDPTNTDGVVWDDEFRLIVISACPAPAA